MSRFYEGEFSFPEGVLTMDDVYDSVHSALGQSGCFGTPQDGEFDRMVDILIRDCDGDIQKLSGVICYIDYVIDEDYDNPDDQVIDTSKLEIPSWWKKETNNV